MASEAFMVSKHVVVDGLSYDVNKWLTVDLNYKNQNKGSAKEALKSNICLWQDIKCESVVISVDISTDPLYYDPDWKLAVGCESWIDLGQEKNRSHGRRNIPWRRNISIILTQMYTFFRPHIPKSWRHDNFTLLRFVNL